MPIFYAKVIIIFLHMLFGVKDLKNSSLDQINQFCDLSNKLYNVNNNAVGDFINYFDRNINVYFNIYTFI